MKTSAQDASSMAKKIREISISEFFAKNRHLLGFDNPVKALLTTVREAVDNALDACEEAHILPHIVIAIEEVKEGRYLVSVEDNGPGIVKSHLPNIFAKLLYGSKFHRLKQSRGQQGIGISAAVMYGQMTTGKAAEVISKVGKGKEAHKLSLQIDTKSNTPKIISDKVLTDKHWNLKTSGTKISIELEGAYKEGKHGVLAYIRQTALANSHTHIEFIDPKNNHHDFPRLVDKLPVEPKEIKPHPWGIELGTFIQFLADAKTKTIANFLQTEFSRVSSKEANAICERAKISPRMQAQTAVKTEAEALYKSIQEEKLMAPATNCLSPLNEDAIIKALYWFFVDHSLNKETEDEPELKFDHKKTIKKNQPELDFNEVKSDESTAKVLEQKISLLTDDQEKVVLDEDKGFFVCAVSRPPSVYRGNPFQIEVGLFYGKSLPLEENVQLYRYANRVPLQYQASACAITKAVISTPWKSYGLSQSRGALPNGPVVVMVCISSVWVPYTSESKEALAHYPEIVKELRLALMQAGRKLSKFLSKRKKQADEDKKRQYIEKYIDPIKEALLEILGPKHADSQKLEKSIRSILEKGRAHKTVKMSKHEITL